MTDLFRSDWLLRSPEQWEYLVLCLAAAVILGSVLIRFLERTWAGGAPLASEQNAVATLSMVLFFWVVYCLCRFDVGRVPASPATEMAAKIAGCLLVTAGAIINVAARRAIGRYWSDQIEIQPNHQIVRDWPYTWARHPMYGSLVFFGVGMGFLALNVLAVATTLAVFLPAVAYRAWREEKRLETACCRQYADFQQSVPMLLPLLPEHCARVARGGLGLLQLWGILARDPGLFLLSALLTFGLSFIMQREDFRIAYKGKAVFIVLLTGAAVVHSSLFVLLWIPVCASFMSLAGHCPGTLLVEFLKKPRRVE